MSLFAGITCDDATAEVKQGGSLRPMEPGVYEDCVITEAIVKTESATNDPNWAVLMFTLAKDGFFDKKMFLVVPKKSMDEYNGKKESAEPMVRKLGEFFRALGLPVAKKSDIIDNIKKVFGAGLDACVGLKITLTIGYGRKAHAKYIKKDTYQMIDLEGEVVLDDAGETPLTFATAKAVEAAAIDMFGVKHVSIYPDIKKMGEPTTPNDLKAFGGKKAKPVVAKVAATVSDDDIPL